MKQIILAILLASTIGCTENAKILLGAKPYSSDDLAFKAQYNYGQVLYIKDGFYRNYMCSVITEYNESVFCKIVRLKLPPETHNLATPPQKAGEIIEVRDDYKIRIN